MKKKIIDLSMGLLQTGTLASCEWARHRFPYPAGMS